MKEALNLQGRHALVCGGSAGIGEATAIALAELGARVTILARRADRLYGLLPILENRGSPRAMALVADLDQRDDLETKVAAYLEAQGPIHIWINNTGGPKPGRLRDAKDGDLLAALGRHLLAAQRLLSLLLPGMEAEGYGRIISVLSTSVREPIPRLGVSNVIRAAMASWSKTLSRELPPGLTINAILPGYTATERLSQIATERMQQEHLSFEDIERAWIAGIPEGRLGKPEEIASTIAFLATPAAAYIRGVCLAVDGGRLLSI